MWRLSLNQIVIYKTVKRVSVTATVLSSLWRDAGDLCVAIAVAMPADLSADADIAGESLAPREIDSHGDQ